MELAEWNYNANNVLDKPPDVLNNFNGEACCNFFLLSGESRLEVVGGFGDCLAD